MGSGNKCPHKLHPGAETLANCLPGLLFAKLHSSCLNSGTYFAVRTDVTKACFPVLGVAQLPSMQHLGEG
jgi:hypothetical protein